MAIKPLMTTFLFQISFLWSFQRCNHIVAIAIPAPKITYRNIISTILSTKGEFVEKWLKYGN